MPLTPDLRHRLLFILHRGLVELRLLGLGGNAAQVAELPTRSNSSRAGSIGGRKSISTRCAST
jgi:hypothetical protein